MEVKSFKLKSDLKPAGDQPKAIEELLDNLERGVKEQVLLGATGTGKSIHPEDRVLIGERKGTRIEWRVEEIGSFVSRIKNKFPLVEVDGDFIVILPREKFWTVSFSPSSFEVDIKPLYSVSFHKEEKHLWNIELEDGRNIRTTGDHNFFCMSEEGFVLKRSSEMGKGDYIPLPRKFPVLSKGLDHIYITDFVKLEGRLYIVPSKDIYEEFVSKVYSEKAGKKIIRAKSCGEVGIPVEKCKHALENYKDKIHIKSNGGVELKNRIELDKDFLEFLGLYIAEGVSADRYILISTQSQYYQELTERIAKKLGLKFHRRNPKDITIYGKLFAQLLTSLCGSMSYNKRLPPFWLNLSDTQKAHILRALFDGDGTVDKTSISLTTKSKHLADDLLYALLSLGIWGRLSKVFKKATNSRHKGSIYYKVSIYGKEVELFLKKVGFNDRRKLLKAKELSFKSRNTNVDVIPHVGRRIKELRTALGRTQSEIRGSLCRQTVSHIELGTRLPSVETFPSIAEFLEDEDLEKFLNLRWCRVKSVMKVPYNGFVYDLSVENNETFLAGFGGIFVHNTFTIANVIAQYNKPTLVVVHNKILAAQLYREFKELFPDNAVEYFISYYDYYQPEAYIPEKDLYIEKDASINELLEKYRHSATISVLERRDVIVVASVSCIYGLGSPEHYESMRIKIRKGDTVSLTKLVRKLVEMGYERNDYAFKRATFSVRGDSIEILPSDAEDYTVRIELWDDEVERIVVIDTLNRHTLKELDEVSFFPASHYIAPRPTVERALEEIERDLKERVDWFKRQGKEVEAQRLYQRTMYDLEMIRELGHCKGIENYSRYFDGREPGEPPFTLLDYFPEDFLLIVDESHMTIPQIRAMYNGDRSRKEKLVEYGWRLPSALDNRPLKFEEFLERINQVIYVSATPSEWEIERSNGIIVEQIVRPTGLVDPQVEVRPTKNQLEDLIVEVKERIKRNERALVLTTTKRLAEEVADYLTERGIKATYMHSDLDAIERSRIIKDLREGNVHVIVGVNLLREGLDLPEVSLVAILEADKEGFLRSYTSLIQTIGRAARNVHGKAILYADRITNSMKRAIEETNRRRKKQEEYNKRHGITPRSVVKPVKELLALEELDYVQLPLKLPKGIKSEEDLIKRIEKLEKQMWEAAKNWEFEKAAKLRDEIKQLRSYLNLT